VSSLSPSFILNDVLKETDVENGSALLLSLFSVIAGSINPLNMADTKDANKQQVVFAEPANS